MILINQKHFIHTLLHKAQIHVSSTCNSKFNGCLHFSKYWVDTTSHGTFFFLMYFLILQMQLSYNSSWKQYQKNALLDIASSNCEDHKNSFNVVSIDFVLSCLVALYYFENKINAIVKYASIGEDELINNNTNLKNYYYYPFKTY